MDFDNTLAGYDRLFIELAGEFGLAVPPGTATKQAVRKAAWSSGQGDALWQKLQAQAYGPRIAGAEPYPGAKEFLNACKQRNVEVFVVSHKTLLAAGGDEQCDLRRAALDWMADRGFFSAQECGLSLRNVFFETTRSEKIRRIRDLDLAFFIDDLPEVLCAPDFPEGVGRILFSAGEDRSGQPGMFTAMNWGDIHNHVLGPSHARRP